MNVKATSGKMVPHIHFSKYGWKRDIPDFRDFKYGDMATFFHTIPDITNLNDQFSPVENQQTIGSCVANGYVSTLEFLMIKDKKPFKDMSRLFVYYNGRVIEHTVNQDSGLMPRDALKSLVKQGCCTEALWPYNIDLFTNKPPASCYEEAMNYQVLTYARLFTLNQIKNCLASGYPVGFGIPVYESFETEAVAKTGDVPMPERHEKDLGGHFMVLSGYNEKTKMFDFRNSWGTEWGNKGYGRIPYAYIDQMASDFTTIRTGENM